MPLSKLAPNFVFQDGVNGYVFDSSEQLAARLLKLLMPTLEAAHALAVLRDGVSTSEAKQPRWAQNWQQSAAPLLFGKLPARGTSPRLAWPFILVVLGIAMHMIL